MQPSLDNSKITKSAVFENRNNFPVEVKVNASEFFGINRKELIFVTGIQLFYSTDTDIENIILSDYLSLYSYNNRKIDISESEYNIDYDLNIITIPNVNMNIMHDGGFRLKINPNSSVRIEIEFHDPELYGTK